MRAPLLALALLAAAPAPAQFQNRIYQPPKAPLTAAALPAGARLVTLVTRDRLTLTGAAIAAKGDRPTLLVFHGNAASATDTLAWFAPLIADGYGIVAAEYRGYAANPGRPDEPGLAADADAFYAEAQRVAAGHRLIVIGHSLGGGVAFGLAMRQRLDALVTIGTFSRLRAMAPKIVRAFIADRYDNLDDVPRLDEPYFLLHGTADDTVPASEGGLLVGAAQASHRRGAWFRIAGAGHHPDGKIIAAIVEAIDTHLGSPDAPEPALPAGVTAGLLSR